MLDALPNIYVYSETWGFHCGPYLLLSSSYITYGQTRMGDHSESRRSTIKLCLRRFDQSTCRFILGQYKSVTVCYVPL
jgi:hypothetical protein